MRRRGGSFIGAAVGALALLAASAPLQAAGFGVFEQGAKAMGMAGAFTAQADDPSALFHNAGGLAFVTESEFAGGVTYIGSLKAEFKGAAPFPGPTATADQSGLSEFLPHGYYVRPINQTWKVGLGVNAPFGLTTEWDENRFAGRFLSTKAALRAVDVNPTIGWQVTPTFGVGLGVVGRFSDVVLERHVPGVNPFTQRVVDIAKIKLESDLDSGYGWNVGVLHRVNESFSWGLSYRSKVKVDYTGDGRLTQISTGNAQLDAALRARLPFDVDLPIKTQIEFPDMASLGFAFALSPDLLLETDANWTGWSTFDETVIDFTGDATHSLPDSTIRSEWDDVYNYRAGLRWTQSPTTQWRVGYVFDETPQPEEAVTPLLPDSDRNGFTVGYGHTGAKFKTDLALMFLDFKERTRAKTFQGESPFLGTYKTQAWLVSATIGF